MNNLFKHNKITIKRVFVGFFMFALVFLILNNGSPYFSADSGSAEETTVVAEEETGHENSEDAGNVEEPMERPVEQPASTPTSSEAEHETGSNTAGVESEKPESSESASKIPVSSANSNSSNIPKSAISKVPTTSESSLPASSSLVEEELAEELTEEELMAMRMMLPSVYSLPVGYEDFQEIEVNNIEELRIVLTKPKMTNENLGLIAQKEKLYVRLKFSFTLDESIEINNFFKHVVFDGSGAPGGGNYVVNSPARTTLDAMRYQIFNDQAGFIMEVKNVDSTSGGNDFGHFRTHGEDSVLSFENLTYTGRQIAVNWQGTVKLKNVTINIVKIGDLAGQEVAEANRIILEGNVVLDARKAGDENDEIFWLYDISKLKGSSSITVKSGAQVEVFTNVCSVRESFFVRADDSLWDFTVEPNAKFSLLTDRGFEDRVNLQNPLHLNSFTVGDNSEFHMTVISQWDRGDADSRIGHIYARDNIYIGENSIFTLDSNYSAWVMNPSDPDGPAVEVGRAAFGSDYFIPGLCAEYQKSITINNPKLLYMHGKAVAEPIAIKGMNAFYCPGTVTIKAQQMNIWNNAGDNTGNYFLAPDSVLSRWVAKDVTKENNTFTMYSGKNNWEGVNTTSVKTKNPVESVSNFNNEKGSSYTSDGKVDFPYIGALGNGKGGAFALGRQEMTAGAPYIFPSKVYNGGTVTQGSMVRIKYQHFESTAYRDWSDGVPSQGSSYSIRLAAGNDNDYTKLIPPNTDYFLQSMSPYLYCNSVPSQTAQAGELDLNVAPIDYGTQPLSALPKVYYVKPPNIPNIQITDGRGPGTSFVKWKLTATMTKKMTSKVNAKHILDDVVKIYHDKDQIKLDGTNLGKPQPIIVGDDSWKYITTSTWSEADKTGIRLEIPTGAAYAEEYEGEIVWTLQDAV